MELPYHQERWYGLYILFDTSHILNFFMKIIPKSLNQKVLCSNHILGKECDLNILFKFQECDLNILFKQKMAN